MAWWFSLRRCCSWASSHPGLWFGCLMRACATPACRTAALPCIPSTPYGIPPCTSCTPLHYTAFPLHILHWIPPGTVRTSLNARMCAATGQGSDRGNASRAGRGTVQPAIQLRHAVGDEVRQQLVLQGDPCPASAPMLGAGCLGWHR